MMKKQVRVYFVDFPEGFKINDNHLYNLLVTRYDVILDENNPDFLFFSCFGRRYRTYNCVKIFYSYENVSPDFNVTDYAIDFDDIDFEDRYCRLIPDYSFIASKHYQSRTQTDYEKIAREKTHFCNFIYSNSNWADPTREAFFHQLSKYKIVDSGGKFLNNIGAPVTDKIAWQRNYKFSIAFENSSKNGYTTEKIYDALRADTIPIYWGNKRVGEDLNTKRFINCHDYKNFDEVIEYIKYLDNNPDSYIEILRQSWFVHSLEELQQQEKQYEDWFFHIFEQSPRDALRTTLYGNTAMYSPGYRLKKKKTLKQRIALFFGIRNR